MKERPLLFSAPMVRAILNGSKTQTRRIVKPQPTEGYDGDFKCRMYAPIKEDKDGEQYPGEEVFGFAGCDEGWVFPYGQIGDTLWVRETFAKHPDFPEFIYRANRGGDYQGKEQGYFKWKPSIFMPRAASRITLEIVGVGVERLLDISEEDAKAEGIERHDTTFGGTTLWRDYSGPDAVFGGLPVQSYKSLWESIHGKGSWDLDPWVWKIEFKHLTK